MPLSHDHRRFLQYKAWADARLYGALAELPPAALSAPQPIVFGSILRTLHHVYAMDRVWQAHLEGRPHSYETRNPADCPSFAALAPAQAAVDAWYLDYGAGLSPAAAGEVLDIAFIGGGELRMSRGDILLHVVNHSTYHRGHIAAMITAIPAEPPGTDLPIFLRETAA